MLFGMMASLVIIPYDPIITIKQSLEGFSSGMLC